MTDSSKHGLGGFGWRLAMAAAVSCSLAAGCTPNVSERDIRGVELPAVLASSDQPGVLLIDARPPSRYRQARLPGAINLVITQVDLKGPRLPRLESAERLIVYGDDAGDPRASGLTLRLLEAGYDGVVLFRGGIEAWTDAGRTLETGDPDATPNR